jgi:hypothetical protein
MPQHWFLHDLLNVLVQIANKIGLQKSFGACITWRWFLCYCVFRQPLAKNGRLYGSLILAARPHVMVHAAAPPPPPISLLKQVMPQKVVVPWRLATCSS